MKNKISKIFLALFSVFLLVGGGIFSACGTDQPQATIEVSSSDFAGDDYIEIDLGSTINTATITARVTGTSAGIVSVNNDYQDKIATSAVYDSKTESTVITIVGKSEGNAELVLKSHGNGQRIIKVYVYSDILALDPSDELSEQYVVRGQSNILNPDKLLKFTSRPNGESNRKDVTWSLKTQDENLSIDGNVLTVGEDYQKFNTEASVEVYADSVYVDKRATIKLNVISPLPDFATYISRTSDAQGTELTEVGQAFNLVKNNDLNEEASLYARLVVPVSSKLNVTPKVYDAEGKAITDKLDITLFNSRIISNTNEIIYLIKAKSQIVEPQKLTVCFDVAYEKYSYTKESTKFTVNLVDVIDRIDVKSNNLSITKNESINVYDYYNNDSSYQFGHPFYVTLGPDTVANSLAKYFVQVTIPAGRSINGTVLLSDQFGNPISFGEKIDSTALGDVYRSQPINNKTVVYIIAGNAFTNGDEIDCVFLSQQSESVNLPIKIRLYNSPKDNFDIDGGDLEYYLSTNKYDSKIVEIYSSSLMGIDKAGVKLAYEENDKIKVSNYQFDSETGKISFKIENLALNLSGDDAKLAIKVEHKNGFVSKQEIVVSAFIPLKKAYVNYQGQSTTSVSYTQYGKQNFNSTNVEGEGDDTLTKLVLKTGSTVSMTFYSDCNANVAFKFVKGVNLDTIEDENTKLQELINATEDTSVTNPLANAGRMSMPSVDVKGYALVTFTGFDEDHQEITFYRYFALEGYTSPTRLTSNVDEEGVELFAVDSISSEDTQLSTSRISIRYRTDGLPVTYFGNENGAEVSISPRNNDNTILISNANHTNETISFDVTALTTNGYSAWENQIIVSYKVFNSVYYAQINVSIKNAQRVEKVVYTNQNPDDGIIYLDVNGTTSNERNAVILTSVTPSNAYNQELKYIFVADSGTQSDLVSVNELGVASFKSGTRVGGTGYIYVLPKDAIRNIGGAQGINYYVEGDDNVKSVLLTEIATKYDEITVNGYFKGKILDNNSREKIYYKESILKIKVIVADGASEDTATRIYNANSLKSIDLNRHYELMNSISLDSDWAKIAGTFNGTLRGHNSNETIRFNGGASIFENIGKEAKVYNLNLAGNVNGAGMLAQTNEGSISNVNVIVYSEGATIKSSTITGKGYVGGIVGINKGIIQDSAVEGATIVSDSGEASLSDIAGGIAGQNSGKILNSRVEFYNFDKDGGNVNTFKAFYVGGIVGELTEGATIKKSYAYNYSGNYPLSSVYNDTVSLTITANDNSGISISKDFQAASGAIVGKTICYGDGKNRAFVDDSFAILAKAENEGDINWCGDKGRWYYQKDDKGKYVLSQATEGAISDSYWGYGDGKQTSVSATERWIGSDDDNFKSYVRGGKAHLTFYQAEAITADDVNGFVVKDVKESNSAKALKISDNSGLLFIKSLKDSSGLDDGERSSLRALNTISVADLLGISDENANKIVISSDSSDITIDGKNIILLNRSDEVAITVSSKYDFTIKKQFTFKIIYAIDEFTIWHDGIETSGFTLQEGRPDGVSFTIKDFVYIGNSGNKFEIKLEDFVITPSLEEIEGLSDLVTFKADGMTASILAKKGTKDLLTENSEEFFEACVQIDLKNIDGEYKTKVQEFTKKTLQIYPTIGAQTIRVPVDQINIEPAYQSNLNVVLVTDDENDQLNLSLAFGGTVLNRTQNGNIYTFSLNGVDRIKIVAVAQEYDSTNALINYALTITVCDEYRSQISESENYTLSLTSQSGTADNEPVKVNIALSTQMINNIDMTNYKAGSTYITNGVVYYSHGTETISVISPGRSTMMQVVIDPTFAYYDHMTLTFENADGAILGITALEEENGLYKVDYSAVQIDGGVRLARRTNGNYNFRLYAAANITTDTVFYVVASFLDKNDNLVVPVQKYELYVSYLPEAEITVNGDISAVVAKGGSLDLVMLLKSDQEIESLVANNVRGITISPQSTWTIEDNGNGTKTMRAKLYAGLNAGIKVKEEDENYINGEFALTAVVSRIFNGAREEKRSSAYITIVDFLPEKATIKNAREKENSSNLVLDSYIGIPVAIDFDYTFNPEEYGYDHSNENDIELVENLIQARQEFEQTRYYSNSDAGFYINYDKESNKVIPITQRIKVGNQMARFVQSSEDENVWTFNYTKFRLNYNEKTNMLTVLGLSSTASPVTVTLIDEIYVASSGKAIKYTIETPFAIDVVTYSDADLPLLIRDEEEFLKVANEGTAQNYILLNDITLKNYTPISANMFKMLDGNGYSINIESFNMEGSGTLNLALFTSIPATTTIKNLKVNYYNGGKINVDTTSSGYTSINVAGLAITNAGIVTNTQVVAYQNADAQIIHNDSVGLQVNLMRGSTPYYIDDNSSVKAQIAGFVLINTGSITNSRVGGESIIVIGDQIGDTNYTYYSDVALNQFVLSGQGDMAGFVLTNSGSIVASGASNIQITNLSTATKTSTAGFAVANGGNIRTSYVEGSKDPSETTQYHLKGSSIISKGTVAGFVVNNTANGVVANAYSNIFISNSDESQSRTSAGFVYKNEGKIAYSYSASKVEKANILQTNFSGVDSNGNSLNLGKIELSYYYIEDYADDTSEDIQGAIENQATLINKDAVNSENAYYGFIFSSLTSLQDGLWEIDADAEEGVKLICRNEVTVSHRYYFSISEDEYALPYSILRNQENTAGVEYNTELGNDCNPILISNANEFKEAMGESKSIYVQKFYNKDKVFGAYRFVSDIMLSDLNNELGNAEVKSIDKIFAGKLDGNGFTIKNISIKSSNNSVGLFGEINNGVVRGVNLEVDNITASSSYTVGALTGLAKNSIISNVSLAQKTVTTGSSNSGKGVLGRNITGGIIGSAFGDCYITGLTSTDVIVQSSFYNDESNRYNIYLNGTFDSKTIRQNENQLRSRFFSDAGIGSVSFAGGIIGYSDTYLTNEISSLEFVYGQNLNDSRYAIKKLAVNGSVDVRGEVVGGVIGFTGINTKAKDISLTISKGDGLSNNLLSYNGFAGSIVGYANGQFHQVYAEHDEKTQGLIETSTKNYYKDGNTETERGELALFKFKEASTGAYKYEPVYVGGLMGVMDTGAITVAYSKINAINHSETGYAGGIAGLVKDSSQFTVSVESLGQTAKTSLLLNEVYASGDVYAATDFAGLFGRLYVENAASTVKLTMMSVNAVNHYGIVGAGSKYQGTYAISSNANATNVQVFPAVVATDGLAQGDIASAKSFGYMSEYLPKDANDNITVRPYEGFVESADYFFKITAVTSFTSSEDGYTETNGAFINSNAWDSDNWTHKITDLYPRINLINKLNYIYLDVYNKVSVVAKMQNSSIEVRVRGKKSVNENVYENVDLTDVIGSGIQNYSGKLVGGTDSTWGTGFGPITLVDGKASGYPGIIINNTLFASTGSGVSISNLNIIVRNESVANQITQSTGTGSDTSTNISVTGGLISSSEVVRGKFENVKLHVSELINITPVVVNDDGYAGLLVPSANSTSFKNITINFFGPDNDKMVLVKNTANAINAGLLAGSIVQASKYEAVKVQDISIRQNNLATGPIMLLKVEGIQGSGTSNVGLYVGSITSASEGNVAAVVLSAKAPDVWDGTAPVDSEEGVQSKIEVTGGSGAVNFGGYYGSVQAAGVTLTLYKEKAYNQKLMLSNAVETSQLNEGGLIGDAALQSFTIINQTGNDEMVVLNTELNFSKSQRKANIGSMFGHVSGTLTIEDTFGGIVGNISRGTENVSFTNSATDNGVGGLIGNNSANLTIKNLKISLSIGNEDTKIDFGNYSVGGVIGYNSGAINANSSDIQVNAEGSEIINISAANYGNFAGSTIGEIALNSFKTKAKVDLSGFGNYGGILGYNSNNVTIDGGSTAHAVDVNSTFDISCDTKTTEMRLGGAIGQADGEGKSVSITNMLFGGAFNVNVSSGGKSNYVGGLIGESSISSSITNNLVYGDVIYTYTGSNQLAKYTFGGLIGNLNDTCSTGDNIIAFTNNNSRKAKDTTSVNAICGDKDSIGSASDVYCSQLVLATNNQAIDLGYNTKTDLGFNTADASKTIIEKAKDYNPAFTNYLPNGHKFNPITSGVVPSVSESESKEKPGYNGIVYYTTTYPSITTTSANDPKILTSAAFIGDFQAFESSRSPIDVVGQNAFVSGVVVNCDIPDTNATEFSDSVGGIANKLQDGIIFACKVTGKLSVGGTSGVNVGGIVGLMQTGRIAECYSSVDIVYRAGKDTTCGTAAAIAVTSEKDADNNNAINYIENTYATGEVASYISANLYAFTNGANAFVNNSYTISHISAKDHTTSNDPAGELGIFGSATTADCAYDKNGTECTSNGSNSGTVAETVSNSGTVAETVSNVSYKDGDALTNLTSGWVADIDNNYGYMRRNFKAFESSSSETVDDVDYLLVPNATKLYQMTNDTTASPVNSSYKLIRDIDLSKTTYNNKSAQPAIVISGKTFEGDNHTIKNVTETLFSTAGSINNLKVETKISEDGSTGISGRAVVANEVGTATNVVATGLLKATVTTVGGLFAKATGNITNCKNYVKIDVDNQEGAVVGGIAGEGVGAEKCINYAPINVASSVGSYAGGIFGKATSEIKYCGNENTVFNGYTAGGNGNYYAAGIAGQASASITNCYNTAMIKAGNKDINAKENEGVAYAAGICALLQGGPDDVSTCYNAGFIEALGSTENATIKYDNLEMKEAKVTVTNIKYNAGNINNVYACAIASVKKDSSNKGMIFQNGLFGVQTISENEVFDLPENSTFDKNGIKITTTDNKLMCNGKDRLGGPEYLYIQTVRNINYVNQKTLTQTRYTSTKKLDNTYYNQAINGEKEYDAGNAKIENIRGKINETKAPNSVIIGGQTYAFIENEEQFGTTVNSDYNSKSITIESVAGSTIEALCNAGYNSFSVDGFKADNEEIAAGKLTADAPILNSTKDKLTFNIYYHDSIAGKTLSYTVRASIQNESETIVLTASNLIINQNGKVAITIDQKLIEGTSQIVKVNDTEYVFKVDAYDEDTRKQYLVYQGADSADTIIGKLKGKEIVISINEGMVVGEEYFIIPAYISDKNETNFEKSSTDYSYTNEAGEKPKRLHSISTMPYRAEMIYVDGENGTGNPTFEIPLKLFNSAEITTSDDDETAEMILTYYIYGKISKVSASNSIDGDLTTSDISLPVKTSKSMLENILSNGVSYTIMVNKGQYDSSDNITKIEIKYKYDGDSDKTASVALLLAMWATSIEFTYDASEEAQGCNISGLPKENVATYTSSNKLTNGFTLTRKYDKVQETLEKGSILSDSNDWKVTGTIYYQELYYAAEYDLTQVAVTAPAAADKTYFVKLNDGNLWKTEANETKDITSDVKLSKNNLNTLTVSSKETFEYTSQYDLKQLDIIKPTVGIYQSKIIFQQIDANGKTIGTQITGENGLVTVDGDPLYYFIDESEEITINEIKISDNTFTYKGKNYYVGIEDALVCGEIALKAGDNIIYGNEGYVYFYDTDGQVTSAIQYEIVKGTGEASDQVKFTYDIINETGTLTKTSISVDDGGKFTYNGTEYTIDIMLKISTTSTDEGKIKFIVEKKGGNNLNWWEKVVIKCMQPAAEQNITFSLNYITRSVTFDQKGKLNGIDIKPSITVASSETIDESEIENYYEISNPNYRVDFKAVGKEITYSVTAGYESHEKTAIDSCILDGVAAESSKEKFAGIVLTKDIDLKLITSSYPGLTTRISGNDKIINYYYEAGVTAQNLTLFNSATKKVKDLKIAGTIFSNIEEHKKEDVDRKTGIFASEISDEVKNLDTYGTISLGRKENIAKLKYWVESTIISDRPYEIMSVKAIKPGLGKTYRQETMNSSNVKIAGSLIGEINATAQDISNYASYSMFNNEYYSNRSQINPTVVNGSGACDVVNYGTIIGANGAYNCAGQTITLFSSQNVTSAHNYGIVKAGDGGNGGVRTSAALTKDSTIDNYAPGSAASGSQKNEGKNNGSVVFYKKGEENYEFQANDTQPLVSNSGIAGYDGNSSWGGMYLVKNYEKWNNKSYVQNLDHEFKSIRKFEYIHYNYGTSNGRLEQTGVGAKKTGQKNVDVDSYNRLVISTGEVKAGWDIEGYYSNENVLYYVNITVDFGADTITIRKGSWIDAYAINQPTNAKCEGFQIS